MNKKLKTIFSVIFISLLVAGGFWYFRIVEGHLSSDEVAQKAIDYINANMLPENITASLVDVTEKDGIIKIDFEIQNKGYTSYVTKNGSTLFTEGIDLNKNTSIVKQDRPDIKLFIMTYCPYGLQAQKVFLPVYNLLKDKTLPKEKI